MTRVVHRPSTAFNSRTNPAIPTCAARCCISSGCVMPPRCKEVLLSGAKHTPSSLPSAARSTAVSRVCRIERPAASDTWPGVRSLGEIVSIFRCAVPPSGVGPLSMDHSDSTRDTSATRAPASITCSSPITMMSASASPAVSASSFASSSGPTPLGSPGSTPILGLNRRSGAADVFIVSPLGSRCCSRLPVGILVPDGTLFPQLAPVIIGFLAQIAIRRQRPNFSAATWLSRRTLLRLIRLAKRTGMPIWHPRS